MAEIILFRPRYSKVMGSFSELRPPLGLLFIAAPLAEHNYKIKIIDEEINPCWIEELNREIDDSTICVGISAITGRQISGGLEFSKIVKEKRRIPVIWGGVHPTILPEQTLKNRLIDIVVKGEGEKTFLKIINTLRQSKSLKDIPNISYKENDKIYSNPNEEFIDLNDLSQLPYHLLDCEKYITEKRAYLPNCRRIFDINTDRGCPYRCGYCYNASMSKNKWRALSASKIVEQIEYIVEKFALDGVNFVSDNFFVDQKRITDICSEIIKRKIRIYWRACCTIRCFAKYDDSFIDLLKESGCYGLGLGVESGSQRVLDLIQKDVTLDEVLLANRKLKNNNLIAHYYFMIGFPGETKEEVLETYKLMMEIYKEYPKAILYGPYIYLQYPGTPLYYKCIEMGFKPPEKLEDWIDIGWERQEWNAFNLPYLPPHYSKWLKKSASIVIRSFSYPKWVHWWFRIRMEIMVKFGIIGPQPEEWVIRSIKSIIIFVKKKMMIKN